MAAGQVSEAEARLEEGRRIAQDIGVPDIEAWYHGPMILLRMHEGRSEEAVPLAAAALQRFPTAILYQAAFAWPCTEAGREEEGSAILARLREEGFPKTGAYLWLLAISMLARTCANLDDAEAASDLHRLLRPHRGQMVLAQSCWLGPVTHHLGLLATTLERYDEADNHFADAAAVQERISARAGLVHTQLQWALMLRRRSLPGDTTQARTLLKSAAVGARASGLAGLLPRIDAHLHQT